VTSGLRISHNRSRASNQEIAAVKPHKLRKLDKLPVTAETDKSLLQAALIGYANANWRSPRLT